MLLGNAIIFLQHIKLATKMYWIGILLVRQYNEMFDRIVILPSLPYGKSLTQTTEIVTYLTAVAKEKQQILGISTAT